MSNPDNTPDSGEPAVPGVRLRLRETQMESADSQAGSGPQYYLSRSGEPVGPFSRAQLESMLRQGEADPEEPGWSEGSPDERPLRDLIGDVEVPANAPAVPPPDHGSAFRTEDSLPTLLWGSLSYPFQGNGPILLVAGTLFFAFLAVLTRYGTLFGWIPYLMASGYFLTTLQGIVQSTGNGDASPPTWPDITHWVGDLLVPCLKWVGSLAVAFGPAYLCFRMVSSMGGDFAESGEFASREQALWLGAALGLFLLGVVYFPMAILGVAMSDSLGALSPTFVARSIAAVPGPYAAVVAMLLALLFVQGGIHAMMRRVPIPMLDHLTGAFISLYFGFVQARILGVLYRSQRDRLGWF
ncbi:MAG: DUF4339 domain-containing protein [Verrucomicrobiales bacterium]|nr:DUF4339 domain-containing protein [Verrucomicrobiales bacterium]